MPAGDAAYSQLAALAPTGWIESRVNPKSGSLTRYEIATETARAILALQSRRSSTAGSTRVAATSATARTALRSLRDLTQKFRPELRELGIDTQAALRLCDELLQAEKTPSAALAPRAVSTPSVPAAAPRANQSPRTTQTPLQIPLSNRVRLETMVSALSRDALDPFGDTETSVSPTASRRVRTGVALDLTPWLQVQAGGSRGGARLTNSALPFSGAPYRAVGGSLGVALPRGVNLTGGIEQISPEGANGASWNRVGGALGFSAWRNRLTLRANWAQLLPSDARLLPASVSGVDVGLDLSERLRLTLLYQQMFYGESQSNRVMSGGININF